MSQGNTGGEASQGGLEIPRYFKLGLSPIPVAPKSKRPLVPWKEADWRPTELKHLRPWIDRPDLNWGLRCGPELHVIDIDDPLRFQGLLDSGAIPERCPVVRSARGGHVWFRPKAPVRSCYLAGLELKGVGSYIMAPPSIHPSGCLYVFDREPNDSLPEIDVLELLSLLGCDVGPDGASAEQPDTDLPPDTEWRASTPRGGSGGDWSRDALRANGIDPQSLDDDIDGVPRELLRLWHRGVLEGRRWLTLNALLRYARLDGATNEDLFALAATFAGRCRPPMPEAEWRPLVQWVARFGHVVDQDVPRERRGPTYQAWQAGFWTESALAWSRYRNPNGEPGHGPLFDPAPNNPSRLIYSKISASEALKRWLDDRHPPGPWTFAVRLDAEENAVQHALDEIGRCHTPGVRFCGEHRTIDPRRPCRHSLHDDPDCLTSLQVKAKVVVKCTRRRKEHCTDNPEFWEAQELLSGPLTLVRLSVGAAWPWRAGLLDKASTQLRGYLKRHADLFPDGAICALRLEPWRQEMALYLLAPGNIQMHEPTTRGRPPAVKMEKAQQPSCLESWLLHVGSAWVGNLPADDCAPDAAVMLLQWSHGRSRSWGIGRLGRLLAKVRLVRPCPVCKEPTADRGWFNPHTMRVRLCVDAAGREYEGVVHRGPPSKPGEGGDS